MYCTMFGELLQPEAIFFGPKKHRKYLATGLRSDPHTGGAYSAHPDSLAAFKGHGMEG